MPLPDSGQVEDYSEAEMSEILQKFETDKASLTKNQKAAVARYNFKKGKGEPIVFRGEAPAGAAASPAAKTAPATPPSPGDVTALLPPEMQQLAGKDPATLTKEEKIALAKAKSQAVKAAAAKKEGGAPEKKGPSPEEIAAQKALERACARRLQERFADGISTWTLQTAKPCAVVRTDRLLDVVRYLHIEMGFTYLQNLTAVDYPPDRMEVVYNLLNMDTREEIALKVAVPRTGSDDGSDLPAVPSVTAIHRGADWLEREVYDMFGIRFAGHPRMVRLLLPEGWSGFPLRKDYDLTKEQYIGMDEHGNDIVSFKETDGW